MADKQLSCIDCGKEFTFTEKDQEFYKEKGFEQPKRCWTCRKKKRAANQFRSNKPEKW
jgi:NAD-dependent SIR2 family protein deacetylase